MSNGGRSKIYDAIISVVLLLWFVASLVGMVYVSKTGRTALLLALFGQFFLVFGIMGLIKAFSDFGFKAKCLPILLLPLVGIGAIASGFIIQYGTEEFKEKCYDAVPYLFIILFAVVGVCLIIAGLHNRAFPTTGQNYELNINAENPKHFYEQRKSSGMGSFMMVLGVVIVLIMGFVLYMMAKN